MRAVILSKRTGSCLPERLTTYLHGQVGRVGKAQCRAGGRTGGGRGRRRRGVARPTSRCLGHALIFSAYLHLPEARTGQEASPALTAA